MILRAASFALILYAVGFILFSVTLAPPAPDSIRTDALVSLTGGPGRIERGVALLEDKRGKRLLISGADPAVTKDDLVRRLGGGRRLIRCCVDLGSESVDTRSNAEEAKRWLDRRGYRSVRLITSASHMRRAAYEFRRVLGDEVTLVEDGVGGEPPFIGLFGEYNKYLLRRIAAAIDL